MSDQIEIKDGGEQTLKCGDCNKSLMHYRIFAPNLDIKHEIVANCPFCSGNSFTKEIGGMFFSGPIGSDENLGYFTRIFDVKYDGNKLTYILTKGV